MSRFDVQVFEVGQHSQSVCPSELVTWRSQVMLHHVTPVLRVFCGSRCCSLKCRPHLMGSLPSTRGRILLSLCSLPVDSLGSQNRGRPFLPLSFCSYLPPVLTRYRLLALPQRLDGRADGTLPFWTEAV